MRSFDKTIITCAVTGSVHIPTMSPHLPITPDEIVEEAVAASEAGASIVHLHVRNPETGEPISDLNIFRDVAGRIKSETDVIIQPTTGGAPTMETEERVAVIPELEPEMATFNMGSFNFGLYPVLDMYDEFKYEWERGYLESTRDAIFSNSFQDLEQIISVFNEYGTVPELECFDMGHLYNAKHFVDRGLLETPVHLQLVMGTHGGIGMGYDHLSQLVQTAEKLFEDEYSFSVIGDFSVTGTSQLQTKVGTAAMGMGGHVRVGLEDSLHLPNGELAESNAQQVQKMVEYNQDLTGREIAEPDDVREFFGLKGSSEVDF